MTFKRSFIIGAIVVALLSLAAYFNTLGNSFLYDDEAVVVRNDFIKSLGNIGSLFSRDYFAASGELSYRPAVTLTYMLDHYFWGLNPSGYHFTNLLLHIFNSVFFFYFAYLLFGRFFPAQLSAAIFAVHPAISEAVNSIGFREDLLAFFFSIVSLIAHRAYGGLKGGGQKPFSSSLALAVCGISYSLALLSKESALVTPALAIALDLLSSGSAGSSPIARKKASYALFAFLTLTYGFVRFSLMYNPIEARLDYPGSSPYLNFLTMAKAIAHYVNLLLFPVSLNADYDLPISSTFWDWRVLLSLAIIVTAVLTALRWAKFTAGLGAGVCWFFIALLPVYNIVPLANIMAERYLYMSAAGFSIAMAGAFSGTLAPGRWVPAQRVRMLLSAAAAILLLAFYMINTMSRNYVWRDEYSLWSDTVLKSPDKSRVRFGLGVALKKAGSLDKALREQLLAVWINPRFAMARLYLGNLYGDLELTAKAAPEYEAAAKLGQNLPDGHNNLGKLLEELGHLDKAMAALKVALKVNPNFADAYNNSGVVLFKRGDTARAAVQFRAALEIRPSYADALFNMGSVLFLEKELDKAAFKYLEALRSSADYADAHFGLGDILKAKGFGRLAEKQYTIAGLKPGNETQTSYRLADLYARAGLRNKAVSELKNAAHLRAQEPKGKFAASGQPRGTVAIKPKLSPGDPGRYALKLALIYKEEGLADRTILELMGRSQAQVSPEALNEIAIMLNSKGQIEKAKRFLVEAFKRQPASIEVPYNLGAIFQVQGARDKAFLHFALSLNSRPDYADALVGLGDTHLKGGRAGKALESYLRAISLDGSNQRAYMNAGAARLSLGMVDGAIYHYKVAIYLGPSSAEANKNLGAIYLQKLMDPGRAKVFFERSLAIDPEGKEAAAMREILMKMKK